MKEEGEYELTYLTKEGQLRKGCTNCPSISGVCRKWLRIQNVDRVLEVKALWIKVDDIKIYELKR